MKTKYLVSAGIGLLVLAAFGFGMTRQAEPKAASGLKNARLTATASEQSNAQESLNEKKALVVYFSYTGNTRALAEEVEKGVGGDLFEIQPQTPYSTDYKTVESQGKREVESGYQPPLQAKVENLAAYDVVFVGTPIWWYTIAPPVATFLAESELAGKIIVPFVTHGGYGAGHSIEDIKKLAPQSKVMDALVLRGSGGYEQEDITVWLKKIGVAK